MPTPSYPAARTASRRVHPHLVHHIETAAVHGTAVPHPASIEAMLDAAFWASLRREEGKVPKVSLAFVPPEQAALALYFERPLPLDAASITRLGPAVEKPSIHLGVWARGEFLAIWGTTRQIPAFSTVVEVIAPGLLVVKQSRAEETAKFANLAVLEGDTIKVIDESPAVEHDCPSILDQLLADDRIRDTVVLPLAIAMRAHGRGGSLLVVPSNSDEWRESMTHPIPYPLVTAPGEVAYLLGRDGSERAGRRWRESLRQAIEAIAGLTAVDGATVVNDQFDVLVFGAKISRRDGAGRVEQIAVTEPIEGSAGLTVHPSHLGGTRHLSAAQFAQDQRNSVALVASQDGRFTAFGWSPYRGMVHAYRLEALLL
ncbi:MAG: hypothetical protein SFV54_18790 [Bryobacteraceae bacterium]|nr:hypothetical protein [Bryobacteraceae bacterium]